MALYNPGGESKAIFKFDAKLGIAKIDDDQVQLTNFKAIFDLDAMEIGHCRFSEGAAPDWHMAPAANAKAVAALQRPEGSNEARPYKWGFRLHLKLTKELAGSSASIREFASNSYVTFNGINALHDEWLSEKDKHWGQLPVVVGKSTVPIPGKYGKLFQPVFAIVGWVDPPEDLIAMRNGKAPSKNVAEAEVEPEALEPVDFSEDGNDFS
jgi:hypothetical protein